MFRYLIAIEPLGLLYGSTGRFLSPENLVGRSGSSFPPSAATVSGIFATTYDEDKIKDLQLAGPFWAWNRNPHNFYVPTPFNFLVKDKTVHYIMCYKEEDEKWKVLSKQKENWVIPPNDKFERGTWLAIRHWKRINSQNPQSLPVEYPPWKYIPHLHPRLDKKERHVAEDLERGSLFLENAVQLDPDACIIYLSSHELDNNCWYRFGGEGHLVNIRCCDIAPSVSELLKQKIQRSFAIITPAVWGSNRLSYREPIYLCKGDQHKYQEENDWDESHQIPAWVGAKLLTERPIPFRYRLGNHPNHQPHQPKLLSRGRYAVPAGTVYVLQQSLDKAWQDWDISWFPREGPSLQRWGCGLALPLII